MNRAIDTSTSSPDEKVKEFQMTGCSICIEDFADED